MWVGSGLHPFRAHPNHSLTTGPIFGVHLSPQAVFERHQLKGAKEQNFREVLSGLDLHHPPCKDLVANQAFYAIGMSAYNVLVSLKLLDLPAEAQGWRIATIIRQLLTVPVKVSTHARYTVATLCLAAGWLRWWRRFVQQWVPQHRPGGQVAELVDSA